jgi:hypothetical protein
MATWGINAVRIPLNEDCWLGINRVKPAYSGSNYQQAIATYVSLLNANGLVAILDLHWSAPDGKQANGQQPMPDADHAVTFWSQVATTFKGNPSVAFDLFNEPYPDSNRDSAAAWNCWLNGGTCPGVRFQTAGMQTLVNTVRNTGATNVILLGGVQYANALDQWLANVQKMPAALQANLAASWHVYDFNACNYALCWGSNGGSVVKVVPFVIGEFGEKNQGPGFIWDPSATPAGGLLGWVDQQNAPPNTPSMSVVGWTWDAWNSWDSLIAGMGTQAYDSPVANGGTFNGVVAYGLTYCHYLTNNSTAICKG